MKIRYVFILSLAFLFAQDAFCRAGGGHSFSGGGGGTGGGGSGGDGGGFLVYFLLRTLIELTFQVPVIGIPIDLIILYFVYRLSLRKANEEIFSKLGRDVHFDVAHMIRNSSVKNQLEKIKIDDPDFSIARLKDFSYALYSQVQNARGARQLQTLTPYLSARAIHDLEALTENLQGVSDVVVGSCTILGVVIGEQSTEIKLFFETNYNEASPLGKGSWFAKELWILTRKKGVHSKPPVHIKALNCPACGAALAQTQGGACASCGMAITSGDFDWFVESIQGDRGLKSPELSGADSHTYIPPTVFDPELKNSFESFKASHPEFQMKKFQDRVGLVFNKIQQAWTSTQWQLARPYESDSVFQMHLYWIEEYKKQQTQNILKDIAISQIVPVKIAQDRYFDSITVRIFASMIDYTVQNGKVTSGNDSSSKPFTEYWTFIRGRSTQPKKTEDPNCCPACGAPLKINAAGFCDFCSVSVVSGDFDWVLSEIEQDQAYGG